MDDKDLNEMLDYHYRYKSSRGIWRWLHYINWKIIKSFVDVDKETIKKPKHFFPKQSPVPDVLLSPVEDLPPVLSVREFQLPLQENF